MQLTVEEQEQRQKYIGSSDAAAVLGMSRWTTPLGLWVKKTGVVDQEQGPEELYKKLGNRLEEVVAELFTEKTGLKVRRVKEPYTHPEFPFLSAQIDRLVLGDDSILECKTASAFKAKEWEAEEIPQEYIIQCVHQLAVTGKKKAWLACLIGNTHFVVKEIERDENTIRQLVDREVEFWNEYVVPRKMPGIVTANDKETLDALFPTGQQIVKTLGDDIAGLCEMRAGMMADLKSLESSIDKADNELRLALGDAEEAIAGQYRITWKNQTARRLDQTVLAEKYPDVLENCKKESTSRVLRAQMKKGAK